jgi:anti-sigma-K factor RskA
MNDSTCPRNEEAVGWALHSLEPDAEIAVAMHLPHCDSCRTVAGEAGEVLAYLGAAVEQLDPPPSLRDRLMAAVADTPQQPAGEPGPAPQATAAPEPAVAPRREAERGSTRPPDTRPGRSSRWTRRGRRLVAGALAVVAVLTIGVLGLRNAQLAAERDAQVAQAQRLENLLDEFDRPGVQHALLAREDGSTIAAVVVSDGQPQVFPIGIPANSVDRETYVLWGIAEAANPAPLGTFDVTGHDQGQLAVGWVPDDARYAAYAISLEPGRTAPAVPTAVVASGPVAA